MSKKKKNRNKSAWAFINKSIRLFSFSLSFLIALQVFLKTSKKKRRSFKNV